MFPRIVNQSKKSFNSLVNSRLAAFEVIAVVFTPVLGIRLHCEAPIYDTWIHTRAGVVSSCNT